MRLGVFVPFTLSVATGDSDTPSTLYLPREAGASKHNDKGAYLACFTSSSPERMWMDSKGSTRNAGASDTRAISAAQCSKRLLANQQSATRTRVCRTEASLIHIIHCRALRSAVLHNSTRPSNTWVPPKLTRITRALHTDHSQFPASSSHGELGGWNAG